MCPLEQVVHHLLVPGGKVVDLVNKDYLDYGNPPLDLPQLFFFEVPLVVLGSKFTLGQDVV